jgi:hypothetical protein
MGPTHLNQILIGVHQPFTLAYYVDSQIALLRGCYEKGHRHCCSQPGAAVKGQCAQG